MLAPLAQQRVPCPEKDFIEQWKNADVIASIFVSAKGHGCLPPVELEEAPEGREAALVEALVRSGYWSGVTSSGSICLTSFEWRLNFCGKGVSDPRDVKLL